MSQGDLTPQQELFAQGLVAGNLPEVAYEKAGYKRSRQHAHRLATKGYIVARLAELRAPVIKAIQIDLTGHLRDLLGLRNMATTAGQFGAAITAETNRGKASGLYIERRWTEHSGPGGGAIEVEDRELARRLALMLTTADDDG